MARNDKPDQYAVSEDAAINARVKQMMEPGQPDPRSIDDFSPMPTSSRQASPPPLDIFKDSPAPDIISDDSPTVPERADVVKDALDDPGIDKAIDTITRAEGDEVLKVEDSALPPKRSLFERFRDGWANWWSDPRKRYGTLGGIVVVLIAIGFTPVTRYFVLNNVGLRASAVIKIADGTNGLPLKNVSVTLGNETAETDASGLVNLAGVKLGKQTLDVHKAAFASYKQTLTVGLGGVSLPSIKLRAVGSQFTFKLTGYLSGKPVVNAEVSSGQATALSDKNGTSILTVQPNDDQKLSIQVAAAGYRTEKFELDPTDQKPTEVHLVPAAKDVFISKASGKYDLYSVDVDGKNRKLLLAATGNENQNISLSVSPDNSEIALVSTRDNQHDSEGYLLSTLTIMKIDGSSPLTIDHSEQINILGWAGGRIIYSATVAGASAANPNRQRIIAYDYGAGKRIQLVSANLFNVAQLIAGTVYYAESSTGSSTPTLSSIKPDSTGKRVLLGSEVWTAFRSGYGTLSLQAPAGWFSYTLGDASAKAASAPDSYSTRTYVDNAAGSKSLWVDSRDGKGVLLSHDVTANKDTVIVSQSGLTEALRWLNDEAVVYRVTTNQQTADYAVSLLGGSSKKITDVTDTY